MRKVYLLLVVLLLPLTGCLGRVADKVTGIERVIDNNHESVAKLKSVVTAGKDATVSEVASARDSITSDMDAKLTANRDAFNKALQANHDSLSTEVKAQAEKIEKVVSVTNAAGDPWVFRIQTIGIQLCLVMLAYGVINSSPIKGIK